MSHSLTVHAFPGSKVKHKDGKYKITLILIGCTASAELSVPSSGDKDTFCYFLFAQTIPNCFTAAGITVEEV